ncbi:putative F-box domain-containing protein [Lupinus albus]|uniref:Putative F-box domain-containing protein n=1 Tax=Lupinus albus TaxID=3870 RepID=A0A6A4P1G0_LUPAL|nr:putative F-box domain-containing protein [Lupinus albus]
MGGTAELGEDLVEYILLRLSVKSLVRFKCVDRSWDVLFKTPTFVQNHLHIHRNEEIFMIRQTHHYRWVTIVNNSTSTIDITYLFPEFNYEINVDGSEIIPGEGIHKLYLWNPTTREVKVVPPPPFPYRSDKYKCIFGLGADPNSINGLEVVPDNYNCDLCGYLVKGVFYWIISLVFLDDDKILCFNFRNNQFHILKRPPTSVAFHLDFINEVNDSTAYVVHGYFKVHLTICD